MKTKIFFLQPQFTQSGDTVFRSVGVSPDDRGKMVAWYGCHQLGRGATKSSFGLLHYTWRDPQRKKIADFPSCGEPGGIYSAKAIEVLKKMLEANGDIHPLAFEGNEADYFLFDCWSKLDGTPNLEFNMFQPASLKSISINGDTVLPDICIVDRLPGLIVSEQFKAAAEAAGLTGMVFSEVEVIE